MSNTNTATAKFQKQLATREARLAKKLALAAKVAKAAGSTFEAQQALFVAKEYQSMAPSIKGFDKKDYNDAYSVFCDIRNTSEDIKRTERDLAYAIEAEAKKTARAEAKAAADLGVRMTCQCCGRDIQSNTGTVAHHGYQRPGDGYQTASCMGAKYLPIEADYSVLVRYIDGLKAGLVSMIDHRDEIANETVPVRFSYTVYVKRQGYGYSEKQTITGTVTRDTFETVMNGEHAEYMKGRYSVTFDTMKGYALNKQDRNIKDQKDYITFQEDRLEAAKVAGVTHKFNGTINRWEAI